MAAMFSCRQVVLSVTLMALGAACAPRQAEVRTAPSQASGPSLQVANSLAQPVNVYVTIAGTDTHYLGQVPARTSQILAVPGFAPGASVNLKAVTVDGTHSYTRTSISLSGAYPFSIP